jgi:diguanylate cyclase (GGDEF)-like protein
MHAVLQRMENLARDNVLWDEPVMRAYAPIDEVWAIDTWGSGTELGLYDVAFILDDRDRTLFAHLNGKPLNQPVEQFLGADVHLLTARLPGDSATFQTVSALFRAADGIYAVSAAPILPVSPQIKLPQARPNRVLFGKRLDAELLALLAEQHVLEGLALHDERPGDDESLTLTGIGGNAIASLSWTSRRPGDIARLKYKDVITAMFVTILVVMGGLVLASWHNFKDAGLRKLRAVENSLRDELTGLANRRATRQHLTHVASAAPGGGLAIIYADLDGFKEINDTYGHDAGDELLKVVAATFRNAADDHCHIARLGGDEFAVVVSGAEAAARARRIAAHLLDALALPLAVGHRMLSIGVSIGIVDSQDGSLNAEELLRRADIAMYAAKNAGRNRISVYDAAMDHARHQARTIAAELRRALDERSLGVVYQPIFDAATLAIVGAEALVRWPRGAAHQFGPDTFIPVAEEHGLIGELGRFVLETACRSATAWPGLTICVNVSPLQFKDSSFPDEVAAILRRTGLDGRRLELEVTESAVIENTERAAAVIARLHGMGVRVSLDDFGSGFSSIGHLRKLQFDHVKLDRSLVGDVLASPQALLLLRATITMAEALGLPCTAEGIEQEGQVALLRLAGCRQFQGYHFSKPLPEAELSALLDRRPSLEVA